MNLAGRGSSRALLVVVAALSVLAGLAVAPAKARPGGEGAARQESKPRITSTAEPAGAASSVAGAKETPGARAPADAVSGAAGVSSQPIAPAATDDGIGERRAIRRAAPAGTDNSAPVTTRPAAGMETGRVVAALAAVVALIFVLRWVGRRFFALPGAQRSSRVMQVLTRLTLSPKQHLLLVRVGRRLIVVADTGAQMTPLSEITDPDEIAALVGQIEGDKGRGRHKAFGPLLGRMRSNFEAEPRTGAADPDEQHDTEALDPSVAATREQIGDLMEKVRLVSRQLKGS